MWIVKNTLRATLKIEGSELEIGPEAEFDLDPYGRSAMEELLPLAVAFEEGYLENIHKDAEAVEQVPPAGPAQGGGVSSEVLEDRLEAFKQSIVDEIRASVPATPVATPEGLTESVLGEQLGVVRSELREGVQGVLESLGVMQSKLSEAKARIREDTSLSEAEVRARIAFLEEAEQNLRSNFESIGHEVSHGDAGDSNIIGNADLLSEI